LITSVTRRTCTTSNWPTRSSGTEVNMSHDRKVTLVGSHGAGGLWSREMSRPVRETVGGRARARERSQMLGW
jgi:hypothetical protein